jgi:hypothetical protein
MTACFYSRRFLRINILNPCVDTHRQQNKFPLITELSYRYERFDVLLSKSTPRPKIGFSPIHDDDDYDEGADAVELFQGGCLTVVVVVLLDRAASEW